MLMQRAVYQIHGPESHHAPGISELDLKATRRGDDGMHDAAFAIERRDARPDDLDGVNQWEWLRNATRNAESVRADVHSRACMYAKKPEDCHFMQHITLHM